MKALFDAIYTKFTATPHNSFYTDISGRMYFDRALQTATFPYCVYSVITDVPEWYIGGTAGGQLDTVLIQFTIFDTDQSAVDVETYFADLKSLYDDCSLTVTGKSFYWMKRETSRLFRDDDDKWCRSVTYRCYLS